MTIDEIADILTAAGEDWRYDLPLGVRVIHDGDPVYRDAVSYNDETAYRVEATGRWYSVGWSDAGKRRVYRDRPMTDAEHFASLHSDDDGS